MEYTELQTEVFQLNTIWKIQNKMKSVWKQTNNITQQSC